MHLDCFKVSMRILSLSFCIAGPAFAAQGQVSLKSTLKLEPSCLINNLVVKDGESSSVLGQIDFGSQSSAFASADAMLSNQFNAIKIHCPENSAVSISFNQGEHSSNIPAGFQNMAQRAMSNGSGQFIAYQLYRDNKQGLVITPSTQIAMTGGTEHLLKIYAEALNNQLLMKGEYLDRITVTIQF